MRPKRSKYLWAAMVAPAAILFQAGACLPEDFPRTFTQTFIVNRTVDVFAFLLDQLLFRLGI